MRKRLVISANSVLLILNSHYELDLKEMSLFLLGMELRLRASKNKIKERTFLALVT